MFFYRRFFKVDYTLNTIKVCHITFTVCGVISPDDLGVTLTHEHISMAYNLATLPPPANEEHKTELPLTMENLGWIRYYP